MGKTSSKPVIALSKEENVGNITDNNIDNRNIEKKNVDQITLPFYPTIATVSLKGKVHGIIVEENNKTKFANELESGTNYMFIPTNNCNNTNSKGNHVCCDKNHPDHGRYIYFVS